ncbi:MAG: DNA repair exonuclease [Clostridia bacterium]|nr:DNA repair exonuclease [Clostridia bacterium]
MNSVKILHTADIHIGAADAFLGANADSRRFETLLTFENIIDLATQNDVDIIAIAGDLFDSEKPQDTFINAVFKKIAAVPQIKVVYCAGNHDPLNSESPFLNNSLPENLYVFPEKDTCFTFEDIMVRVYGRSFTSAHLQGQEEFTLEVPKDDYINIMVQHGELKGDLNSDYNAITPRFIKKSGMDYIALGHVHKHTPVGKIENTYFAYCGCPEGQGFDELDQKGIYIGQIEKGKANLEFIPVSKRQHIHETIDVTGISDITTHTLTVLQQKYENFADNLYKIELIGEIDEDFDLNLSEITTRLKERLYFAKVKDSTEYKIDLDTLAKEPTLKGVFVKNMLSKMKNTDNPLQIKKALKLGLKAFSREVKYNED